MTGGRGPRTSTALLESAVIGCFRSDLTLNRAEIADRTGLSRTVVTSLVNTLVTRGALTVVRGARSSSPGRPAYAYQLSAASAPVALVRLDGGGTHLVLTAGSGTIARHRTSLLPEEAGWEQEIRQFLADPQGREAAPIRHVVVSAPFPVPPEATEGRTHQEHPEDAAQASLRRVFAGRVLLVNDAHLAALGEAVHGAAAGTRASIHLSVRHGVGAGLVIDGRLFTGADGTAGELAHVQVAPDGPRCLCGNHGCLATRLAHKDADLALAALHGRPLTRAEADALVTDGDPQAVRYYRDLGELVAEALAGTVTVLTPDALVVDAQLGPAHVPFTATLAAGLARHCPPGQIQNLRLLRGRLADAQACGAAAYEPATVPG